MNFETILEKFGLPGVIICILIVAIKWGANFVKDLMKEQKAEREEQENQHRREREGWNLINHRQLEESNKNINKNTEVLSELTTLIKSIKK